MIKRLCNWILYGLMGWQKNVTVEHPEKFIICLAPHTSNWDFVLGQLYMRATGLKSNFLMKKEWFVGPLGFFFKRIGGIPVQRSKNTKMTDYLAAEAMKADTFQLCVTPEGTRSLNAEWKKGFYFIAQKAHIPVLLYGVDYQKKLIQCTESFIPTGDIETEMRHIKLYYKDFKGKHPELFTIGDVS